MAGRQSSGEMISRTVWLEAVASSVHRGQCQWDPGLHQEQQCQQAREVTLPLSSALVRPLWAAVPRSWLLWTERCGAPEAGPVEGTMVMKGLMHRKSHLNMRKNFFTGQVTEHWKRLPSEGVESLSWEILQRPLDPILCYVL